MPAPAPSRRALLGLAGAAALPAAVGLAPRRARAVLPGMASLLVPGPEDGGLARWARRLAEALVRGATVAVTLEQVVLGGPDGVTAANRFATVAGPDGRTLLVLTGAAVQARLVGEKRAHFDPAGWLPVCAVQALALVAGRRPMPPAGRNAPLRLGLGASDAAGMAALFGLDLLGFAVTPVPGLGPQQAEGALLQGAVDAIVLAGADASARLAALRALPWCSLDPLAAERDGGMRDPSAADAPALLALAAGTPAPQFAALRAACAAATTAAAVVLPALTPANLVALWRAAAQRWLEEEARIAPAGLRLCSGVEAAPLLAGLAPGPEALLAYREWLLRRAQRKAGE